MQKRRGGGTSVLPMTESDVGKPVSRRNVKGHSGASNPIKQRVTGKNVTEALMGVAKLLLAIVGIGVVVVLLQEYVIVRGRDEDRQRLDQGGDTMGEYIPVVDDENRILPLKKFKSLQYPLQNSDVVILYFGASWCPTCKKFTELLDQYFGDDNILLKPPISSEEAPKLPQRHGLSLVYVSSDMNEEEFKNFVRVNWFSVPYGSDESADLKRHFKACAKRELETLNMERKHEIPTAVIISGETHETLTFEGVKDLQEHAAQAVDHWLELNSLATALDSKFEDGKKVVEEKKEEKKQEKPVHNHAGDAHFVDGV